MLDVNGSDQNESQTDLDRSEYKVHTKKYTKLLENYVEHTKESNTIRNNYKKHFFKIIMAIMILLSLLFIFSIVCSFCTINRLSTLDSNVLEIILGVVTSVIASFVTMLVSLFELPKIIAHYLFNREENDDMSKIIGQIQKYDMRMYSIELNLERSMMNEKKLSENNDVVSSDEQHDIGTIVNSD